MKNLRYREFTFRLDIGTGAVEQVVSPIEDGIDEDEWASMSDTEKEDWLDRALEEWALGYMATSWK